MWQVPSNICSDGGCMTRYFQWASGLRSDTALAQEAVFFQRVAPVLGDGVSTPKVYHVGLEGSFSHNGCFFVCCFDCCFCIGCKAGNVNVRSSIVQEDLTARGLISTHLMSRDSPPLSVMRTAIRQIAWLHRWGWMPPPGPRSGGGADYALLLKTRADAPESGVCAQKTGQHWWVRNTVEAYGGSPALETFIDVWSKCNWTAVDRTAGVQPGEPTLEWEFLKNTEALTMLREMQKSAGAPVSLLTSSYSFACD